MKRILCLIDTLGIGGAERQMVGLAIFLKEKGYEVDLVAYYPDDFYTSIARKGGIEPIIVHWGNSQWSKFWGLRKYINISGGYDCVIAYKYGPNIMGCILKLLGAKFKLIVSERIATQKITRSIRKKFFLYRFADYVVPNSYSQKEFITKYFNNLITKTVVITNFTDTNHFVPIEYKESRPFKILTAARIAKQKNVLNFLKTVAKIKNDSPKEVIFEWYGDVQKGEEKYAEAVMNKLKELGIEDTITFYPNVSDIRNYYQECDAFCLPSSFEGYPNAVCEAMSCGKPILCSRVCDNPVIVEEGVNGFMFDPQSVDDMCKVIKKYIELPTVEKLKMGICSRRLAEQKFSGEAFVDKYIKLIES